MRNLIKRKKPDFHQIFEGETARRYLNVVGFYENPGLGNLLLIPP
jgi:hypothetical protein